MGCQGIPGVSFSHFKDYPNLKELHIGQSMEIANWHVKHLRYCHSLMILVIRERTRLTPSVYEHLKIMTNLRMLKLPPDLFSSETIEKLRRDLLSCHISIDQDDNWKKRYLE